MKLLTGKTALITGANRGIGRAIALKFAEHGADIAFSDIVLNEHSESLEKEAASMGVKCKGYRSDASSFSDSETLCNDVIGDFQKIDILVNNAGITRDNLLMRLTDIIYAFPDLLFFIIVMVSLRETPVGQFMNGLLLLFAALAIVSWVTIARLVRGQVLSLKQKEFIEAGRMIGAPSRRIMSHHLLPNILGIIIVYTAFRIPALIITEAILGYLGIGMRPATNSNSFFITSWGSLMLDGQAAINSQLMMLLAPAVCVALVVMAFTFLGDGLRDAFDPRMAGTK